MKLFCWLLVVYLIISLRKAKGLQEEKIVNGKIANSGEFQSTVSIQIKNVHKCGGGIIGQELVMTAAHCVLTTRKQFYKRIIKVVAFASELNSMIEYHVKIDVIEIYLPNYYKFDITEPEGTISSIGDIAILKLRHNLQEFLSTRLSVLRPPEMYFSHLRKTFVVTGYGHHETIDINPDTDEVTYRFVNDGKLRYAEVEIVSNYAFQSEYTNPLDATNFCGRIFSNDNFCAGLCDGDSGGPLVYGDIIVGIASVGNGDCNETLIPTVYTRVSHYLWLIENVRTLEDTSCMKIVKWFHDLGYAQTNVIY